MSAETQMTTDPAAPLIREGAIHGTNPADGQPLEPVPVTDPVELPALVASTRRAAEAYADGPIEERAARLRRFRDALLARGDSLVRTLSSETGKPEAESWLHEVVPTADLAAYWSSEGPSLLAAHEPELDALNFPGKRAVVERVPRGVIALITPWNFPVALPLRTLFPALLAGNGIVLKPSEYAPRCAALIEEAAREVYGADLVRVVQGGGKLGERLIGSGVDAVVFTGSGPTGRNVAHAAADVLVPVSLELGGKDAAVVLDDADIERTARGVLWGAIGNSGQNCAAIERVYATAKVAGPLRDRLAALARELEPGRDFGPLTTEAQRRKVEDQVEAARREGAEVLAGGAPLERAGHWYAPTVLALQQRDSEALREETFGPLIPVVEVPDERTAIEAANASRYGLTASVWTRKLGRGESVARQLRVGVVMVNNHGFSGAIPSLPWGGVGESGYGVTNSPYALDTLTRPRSVLVDGRRAKRELWWHPYTPALVRIGRAMATVRRRAGPLAKLRALLALVGGFLRRWKV